VPDESLEDSPQPPVERFAPTGGRVSGVLGLLLAAAVVVLGLVRHDDVAPPVTAAALVAGVLAWAALLRPRVSASTETMYLRNMLETVEVPLAAVDELVVRQVLAVRVGEKKFVSPAVGRKLRKIVKVPRPGSLIGPNLPESIDDGVGPSTSNKIATEVDYADHVESRLRELVDAARQRHGVTRYSDEALALAADVRRRPAWPEIMALGAGVLLFVLTLLI
jgi:hypothetical protein